MFLTTQYTPEQHKLINGDKLDWCKRQVSDPVLREKVFMYYHLKEKTFVIGCWIANAYGLFVDVLNMGFSLSNFNASLADMFKQRFLKPQASAEMEKEMKKAEAQFYRDLDNENEDTRGRMREQYKDTDLEKVLCDPATSKQ